MATKCFRKIPLNEVIIVLQSVILNFDLIVVLMNNCKKKKTWFKAISPKYSLQPELITLCK